MSDSCAYNKMSAFSVGLPLRKISGSAHVVYKYGPLFSPLYLYGPLNSYTDSTGI